MRFSLPTRLMLDSREHWCHGCDAHLLHSGLPDRSCCFTPAWLLSQIWFVDPYHSPGCTWRTDYCSLRLDCSTGGRIWVQNRVDFSKSRNLVTVAVSLSI